MAVDLDSSRPIFDLKTPQYLQAITIKLNKIIENYKLNDILTNLTTEGILHVNINQVTENMCNL